MNRLRRPCLAAATLLLTCLLSAASATSLLGMRYPAGIPVQPDCGLSLSLGSSGTGVNNDQTLMLHNPANLGNVRKTVFSSLLAIEFTNITDEGTGSGTNHARFLPRQVGFGFPLGILGAVALSYDKRSDAQMRFEFTPVTLSDTFATLRSYSQAFTRDGGTSVWQVGWGRSIGRWAQVGLSYERVYLRLAEARIVRLTADFSTRRVDTLLIDYRGNAVRGGVMVPIRHWTVGLAGEYHFPTSAYVERGVYIDRPAPQMTQQTVTMRLPPSLQAGVSWAPSARWLVAAEAGLTLWDEYYPRDVILSAPLRDKALSIGGGGQFIAGPELLTPRYWETIQWRLGGRYTQLPAKSASEFAFTLGTGLPLPRGGGLLDLVVEYGRRLDRDYTDYTEEFLRIAVGISGGRKWTKSPEETY